MPLDFAPPLLNSATPWATTRDDIQSLYDCQYTGAVTIRTCTTKGYPHDARKNQFCFIDTEHSVVDHSAAPGQAISACGGADCVSSINTLVYSPIPFVGYLDIVRGILATDQTAARKPIIFSVAGSISEIRSCYSLIHRLGSDSKSRLLMEINLACPNVAGKQPPAYSEKELNAYLQALAAEATEVQQSSPADKSVRDNGPLSPEVGIKLPPYTYRDQFIATISALRAVEPCPITFITTTNTLGSCLVLSESLDPALNSETGAGVGGLAGAAIHPLALGNVRIIRSMLDEHEQLKHISVIGVGGVFDRGGYRRMLAVGAEAVGVGTGLGKEGIGVFIKILKDVESVDEDMEAIQDKECLFSTKRARLNSYPATNIQVPPRRDELHPQLQMPKTLTMGYHSK